MPTFKQDSLHSLIEFKIKHLMISNVRGRFNSFDVTMMSENKDFSDAKIFCNINVQSIDTGIKDRDDHLRSEDFFDADKFPEIGFFSKELKKVRGKGKFKILGNLIIKGKGIPVELDATYNGMDVDNYDSVKHGFDISGKIKRSDWDLDFNIPGGKNTLLIGDEVLIEASIQLSQVD